NLHAPATPRGLRLMPAAEANVERDEEIAVLVAGRAEGELVVISGDAELVANCDVVIGHVVAIAVHELGQLGSLHDENVVALDVQAERLMQAGGEQLV